MQRARSHAGQRARVRTHASGLRYQRRVGGRRIQVKGKSTWLRATLWRFALGLRLRRLLGGPCFGDVPPHGRVRPRGWRSGGGDWAYETVPASASHCTPIVCRWPPNGAAKKVSHCLHTCGGMGWWASRVRATCRLSKFGGTFLRSGPRPTAAASHAASPSGKLAPLSGCVLGRSQPCAG